jgi:hypothetical protein
MIGAVGVSSMLSSSSVDSGSDRSMSKSDLFTLEFLIRIELRKDVAMMEGFVMGIL